MDQTPDFENTHPASEEIPQPEVQTSWSFWKPLVVTSSVNCIVVFLAGLTAHPSYAGVWAQLATASVIFAQSQLSGMFAALGTEDYLKRVAISQACLFAVFLSLLGGVSIVSSSTPNQGDLSLFVLSAVCASVTGQIVFAFTRFVFGWRLHLKDTLRGPIYSLKDLFSLTLYLAVVISLANASFSQLMKVSDEAGFVLMILAAIFLVGMLIHGIPTLASTFRAKDTNSGLVTQFIVVVVTGFLICMPLAAMAATGLIGPMAMLLCGCAALTWLPLVIMRENGLVLSNGKEED